jgi:hypothetical protein
MTLTHVQGMGAAKEMRLPHFAATFAQAGYGVLLFDYATWGGSTGEPRQLVRGTRHAQDYMAAGRHVQVGPCRDRTVCAWRDPVVPLSGVRGSGKLKSLAREILLNHRDSSWAAWPCTRLA